VKLQWLAAASDRLRVAERPRFRRAYRGRRWSGSGLPCDHGRTSSRAAPQNARLRRVALGILIPNAFFVEAAPRRFVRCRHSAIHAETDTYDPRRPGATSSLLSCRQSQTLVGALIPAVVMSGVVDSERKIDANDPTRTSTASARARLGVRSSNLFGRAILCGEGLAGPCAFRQGVSLSRRVAVALAQKYRKQPHAK